MSPWKQPHSRIATLTSIHLVLAASVARALTHLDCQQRVAVAGVGDIRASRANASEGGGGEEGQGSTHAGALREVLSDGQGGGGGEVCCGERCGPGLCSQGRWGRGRGRPPTLTLCRLYGRLIIGAQIERRICSKRCEVFWNIGASTRAPPTSAISHPPLPLPHPPLPLPHPTLPLAPPQH